MWLWELNRNGMGCEQEWNECVHRHVVVGIEQEWDGVQTRMEMNAYKNGMEYVQKFWF